LTRSRVLLVEDEDPKRQHIIQFLNGCGLPLQIQIAKSVNSALDLLTEPLPDLLLLDMSLPTFDVGDGESGGRPQGFGGIEVLRHLSFSELTCPTLVITGYEAFPREAGQPVDLTQLREDLEKEFPDTFKGVLHYNSTLDEWKIALKSMLFSVIGSEESKQ